MVQQGTENTGSKPDSRGGRGRVSIPQAVMPPKIQFIDSGWGHRFTGARVGLPFFEDVVQLVTHTWDFNARGIWTSPGGSGISTSSFYGPNETFWSNAYAQLVYFTEDAVGYRHTPATLVDPSNFTKYISDWVKCVANVFSLMAAFSLDGWNQGTFLVSDALRAIGAHRGRLLNLYDTLSGIPMYPYFRELAVRLGKVAYDRPYGLVYLKLFTWDSLYSHSNRTWAISFDPLDASAANSRFDWSSGASGGDLSQIIDDIESSVHYLLGRTGAATDDLNDMQAIRQLMEILDVPRGLPSPAGLVEDRTYVDHFMYRQMLAISDTHGVGADEYNWMPYLNQPVAGQTELSMVRRGLGVPTEYYLTGMDGCLGAWITGATGIQGIVGNVAAGASMDLVIYGALRRSEGGTGLLQNGDTNPGFCESGRFFTRQTGLVGYNMKLDYGDAVSASSYLHSFPWVNKHQWGNIVPIAGQVAEEHRTLVDQVDFEYIQPLSTVPEILRRQMGSVIGLPVS